MSRAVHMKAADPDPTGSETTPATLALRSRCKPVPHTTAVTAMGRWRHAESSKLVSAVQQ